MRGDLPLLVHLRHVLNRPALDPAPDAELVRRFVSDRDEAAFGVLMDRHGPLVLGVARRVLGDGHLAEDVFQATFLTLSRQARRLRRPAALPGWLHRTAYHLALTAARADRRRGHAEAAAARRHASDPLAELSSRELLAILDEELRRLPEVFRLPLILCCLEGRSQDDAATLLGWTRDSVRGRLERGRQRLRRQLARRGLTLAVGAGVPLLIAPPAVAGTLANATLQAVLGGRVAQAVAALANAAPKPLLAMGWKALLFVAFAGLAGTGVAWVAGARNRRRERKSPLPGRPLRRRPRRKPQRDEPLARFGSPHLRIGNADFALTPDGKAIVTVTPEGTVRTFDAHTGRLLDHRQLVDRSNVDPRGHWQTHLAADGKTFALRENGRTGRVTVYDVTSGKQLFRRVAGQGMSFGYFALSPDGKKLAINECTEGPNEQQVLHVYDVQTGQGKALGNLEFNVYDVRFTANARRVFVSQTSADGRGDSTFACFDVAAGKQLWKLPRNGQEYAVTSDGATLISAVFRGTSGFQVIETDAQSGRAKDTHKDVAGFQAHPNVRLAFLPDNRTVVMSHFEHFIVWDFSTGKEVRRFPRPFNRASGYGQEMGAIAPDGGTMITNLGHLQRWDLTSGKPLFDPPPEDGLRGPVEHLAFTADGKVLVGMSYSLQTVRWDVMSRKLMSHNRERFGRQLVPTPAGLRSLGTTDYRTPHEVNVYDPVAGQQVQTVRWAKPGEIGINGLRAYRLTADGKTLLIAHAAELGPARRPEIFVTACDAATGRRAGRFTVPADDYLFVQPPFSPCGRWAVLGGKVYSVGGGKELFTPSGEPGESLTAGKGWEPAPVWFSTDGRLLAGRLQKREGKEPRQTDTLAVWELPSGKMLARFPRTSFVAQVAFCPDGRTVAFVDGRGIGIHDLLTGKSRAVYTAPDVTCDPTDPGCSTQTLVFSPDGHTLATGHRDGSVQLWKVPPAEADPSALAKEELEKLWSDLSSESPQAALAAVQRLSCRPAEAVALLKTRFPPPPAPADPELAALIKDLDSDVFATREAASRKLREHRWGAALALRKALAGRPSVETRRRVEDLLAAFVSAPRPLKLPVTGATLQGVRAIEVLGRLGTPEARGLLEAWAEQARQVHLAEEARAVLGTAPSGPR